MKTITPDILTKLMSLPDTARAELMDFLGATPKGQKQLKKMADEIEALIIRKGHDHAARPS